MLPFVKHLPASAIFFAFLIMLPAIHTTTAQSQSSVNEISRDELRGLLERNVVPTSRAVETVGSPYLFGEFRSGVLTLFNGRETEPLMMNFNAYENRVEYQDERVVIAVPGERIRDFTFIHQGEPMLFRKGFSARGLHDEEFVQVLTEGKVTFLMKHDVSFQENVAAYGTATQRDEYISNERFYVHQNGETERVRRLTERNVKRLASSFESELNTYVNERGLDLSTPGGAAAFLNHYNQLNRQQ